MCYLPRLPPYELPFCAFFFKSKSREMSLPMPYPPYLYGWTIPDVLLFFSYCGGLLL